MHGPFLKDIVNLLIGGRKEYFPNERAIKLYQFQVWVQHPDEQSVKIAGVMAAAKILIHIQDDIFCEEDENNARGRSPGALINLIDQPALTVRRISDLGNRYVAFRTVHDAFAKLGGLSQLLEAPMPSKFDDNIRDRIESNYIVSELVDYRLRYALTIGAAGNAGSLRHAKFFVWWPTRKIPGRRGQQLPGKAPSPKTRNKWSKEWSRSANFIFLIERCGFLQVPIWIDDPLFVDKLLESASDVHELKRFFGSYAFVRETIKPGRNLLPDETVLPRVPVEVSPFTAEELKTIAAYDADHSLMGNYALKDDD